MLWSTFLYYLAWVMGGLAVAVLATGTCYLMDRLFMKIGFSETVSTIISGVLLVIIMCFAFANLHLYVIGNNNDDIFSDNYKEVHDGL